MSTDLTIHTLVTDFADGPGRLVLEGAIRRRFPDADIEVEVLGLADRLGEDGDPVDPTVYELNGEHCDELEEIVEVAERHWDEMRDEITPY